MRYHKRPLPRIETEEEILTEIVFLVDRSGSMSGSRLNQAKNALQLFLRSLPEGTLFNIIGNALPKKRILKI
jgi:predicted metal-dependent peptidase